MKVWPRLTTDGDKQHATFSLQVVVSVLILCPVEFTTGFYTQPEAVHFLESPNDIVTCDGCGPVKLTCTIPRQATVADLPQPELHWTVNGTPSAIESNPEMQVQTVQGLVSITSTLTLHRPHLSHSGQYRCVAVDGAAVGNYCVNRDCVPGVTVSKSARVLVPSVATETVHLSDCSTVALSCGSGAPPYHNERGSLTYRWTNNSQKVQFNEDKVLLSNGDFLIRNHGDSRGTHTLTCIAQFQDVQAVHNVSLTAAQYEVHLNSATPPSNTVVMLTSNNSVYLEGVTVELVCTHTHQCNSSDAFCSCPRVIWYVNGRLKSPVMQSSLLLSDHILKLDSASLLDSGEYCCQMDLDDVGLFQDCVQVAIVERPSIGPSFSTRFISVNTSSIRIENTYSMVHKSLVWFHNGVQLEGYHGNSSLTVSSAAATGLYGIYQCFLQAAGGLEVQTLLTRYLPYGLSNPPGMPAVFNIPRRLSDNTRSAVRVEFTPPVYTGGEQQSLMYVLHIIDLIFGTVLTQTITDNTTIVFLDLFLDYKVFVRVVSAEDQVSVSENSHVSMFYNSGACADALYPPVLGLECQGGRVTVSWQDHPDNPHWGTRVYYATGGCLFQNETVKLPQENTQSTATLSPVMNVGTTCAFEAAAATRPFSSCQDSEYCCYDRRVLEYTHPIRCNVTAFVEFEQLEYRVQEYVPFVEVCVSGLGYGFTVSIRTQALTATGSEDYDGLDEQLEFSIASDVSLTQCVNVSVLQDGLVEHTEEFNVLLTTEDTNVVIGTSLSRIIIVDNDYILVAFTNSVINVPWPYEAFSVCIQTSGGQVDQLSADINLSLQLANTSKTAVTSHFQFEPVIAVHGRPNVTVCTTVRVSQEEFVAENLDVYFTLSSDDPRVMIDSAHYQCPVVFAEKMSSGHPGELKLVIVGGVLAALFTFLMGASLLLTYLFFAWKHHTKLRYAREMRLDRLSKTETLNLDSQDLVSVGPVNPLHAEMDNVTLCDEFTPCSPHINTKPLVNEQELTHQNVLLTSFQFTQFGNTSGSDLDENKDHLQSHSLATDFFAIDVLEHSLKSWDSESRKQCDEGHHSAFSSGSQYIHFNQCNCQCKDCCAVRRISNYQMR